MYLFRLWKRIRKYKGFATGITQNVSDTLQSYKATTMVANSEFIVLLAQSKSDLGRLSEVINISEAQMEYITENPSGTGLLKFGSVFLPFDNRVDRKSKLYEMYNTDPQVNQGEL